MLVSDLPMGIVWGVLAGATRFPFFECKLYRYVEVALLRSYVISLLRYAAMSQFGCSPFTLFAFSVCTRQCTVIEQNGMSVIDSSDPSCLELLSKT